MNIKYVLAIVISFNLIVPAHSGINDHENDSGEKTVLCKIAQEEGEEVSNLMSDTSQADPELAVWMISVVGCDKKNVDSNLSFNPNEKYTKLVLVIGTNLLKPINYQLSVLINGSDITESTLVSDRELVVEKGVVYRELIIDNTTFDNASNHLFIVAHDRAVSSKSADSFNSFAVVYGMHSTSGVSTAGLPKLPLLSAITSKSFSKLHNLDVEYGIGVDGKIDFEFKSSLGKSTAAFLLYDHTSERMLSLSCAGEDQFSNAINLKMELSPTTKASCLLQNPEALEHRLQPVLLFNYRNPGETLPLFLSGKKVMNGN